MTDTTRVPRGRTWSWPFPTSAPGHIVGKFTTEDTEPTEQGTWITAARPSRRPLRGLLRVRPFL